MSMPADRLAGLPGQWTCRLRRAGDHSVRRKGRGGPGEWAPRVKIRGTRPSRSHPREPAVLVEVVVAALGLGAAWAATGVRVIKQYERGLVFRFGRVRDGLRG